MDPNLYIDDEYCAAMGKYFADQGAALDQMVSDYIAALQTIRNDAIKGGDLAVALDTYISYAGKMKDQFAPVSGTAQTQTGNFIADVDAADQYTF